MRKRSSLSELVSPAKKGPAASPVSVDTPEENTSITPVFNSGFIGKAPARALFKAARKGKTSLFQLLWLLKLKLRKRVALSSLLSNNENPILEL
jgi:hypothetical protein